MQKRMSSFFFNLAVAAAVLLALGCQLPGGTGADTAAIVFDSTGQPGVSRAGLMVSYGYCPNFPAYVQVRSTWCWAAVARMICVYVVPGFNMYQSDIVREMCGEVRDTPEGISPGDFWPKYGVHHTFKWGTLSWDRVKYYLDLKRPISADIQHKSNGGNHAVVIWGYAAVAYPEEKITRYYLMIADPADGKKKSVEYSYFVNNSSDYWRLTRYNIYWD